MSVKDRSKLFRAIVVMGAALTSGTGCEEKCNTCPVPDAPVDSVVFLDAGTDGPTDAPVDVVLIL